MVSVGSVIWPLGWISGIMGQAGLDESELDQAVIKAKVPLLSFLSFHFM